jgi:hypothetical protein
MTPVCRTSPTGAMTRAPAGRSLAFSINLTPRHVRFCGRSASLYRCPDNRGERKDGRPGGTAAPPVVVPFDAPEPDLPLSRRRR